MTNKNIDIFIISYNRLSYLRSLIEWLEKAGFENIHIVDNCSTYRPLVDYLKSSKHKVHILEKNYGHLAVWKCGKFKDIINRSRYIVTDCDVLPIKECPSEVVGYFSDLLDKYGNYTKVGFSLRIDDIPMCNASRNTIINWEKQFWQKRISNDVFDASIDTTFAMYNPGIYPESKKWWKSLRTDFPYMAMHLPWYEDTSNLNKENVFYQNSIDPNFSFWSINDLEMLKEYNKNLLKELDEIYNSRKWKILQVAYLFGNLFFKKRFSKRIGKKNKPPKGSLQEVAIMQQYNKKLVVELGSVKSSGGWKLLEKIENNFDYLFSKNHL